MKLLSTRRGASAIAAMSLVIGGLAFAASPAAAESVYADQRVIVSGHADVFFATVSNGSAQLVINDESSVPHENRSPEDVVFHVKPSVAERTANAYIASGIPGFASVGDTIYTLPQNNVAGTIFAGFGHDLPSGSNVEYTIDSIDGPGNFAQWQAGDEGPIVFTNSAAGLPAGFSSQANHEHLAWGFTELGEYQLNVYIDVTQPGQSTLRSETETYTFYVGEELPEAIDPGPGNPGDGTTLTVEGAAVHYHAGEVATLTATADQPLTSGSYAWFTQAPGASDWTEVDGVTGETYGFIVRTEDHGLRVKVALRNEAGDVVSESGPVTVDVDDHGNSPIEGPVIQATLPVESGSLVVSTDAAGAVVPLSDFALNSAADGYIATGEVTGLRVTDTRAADPGWNVNGRVRSFTTPEGASLTGNHLGWAPKVISTSDGQSVNPGAPVSSVRSGGDGVGAWRTLGSADAGAGRGSAELGADLTLEAPTSLQHGTYSGLLILTAI